MSREDQYNVTVQVAGRNLGPFDKMEGGEVDSEETKYKPGGMAPQLSLGGFRNVGNVTVRRLYDLSRDHALVPFLHGSAGVGEMVVVKQPLDVDGNVFGSPVVYRGKLKQVTLPDFDSESSDAALLELEMSSAGQVA